MTPATYVSYAQNREDVVLHRALTGIQGGHYVEVGANDPTLHSISRGFYELGWTGLTIDPVHDFVQAHRDQRPRDTQFEAAITDADTDQIVLHQVSGTGLSTLDDRTGARHHDSGWETVDVQVRACRLDAALRETGWWDQPVHFLVVDVEGAESAVLASIDLRLWRPWILVIEATEPLSTEAAYGGWEPQVLAADYQFVLFDGLSRFYVAAEHRDELGSLLSYPACVHDDFVEFTTLAADSERERLLIAATELTAALQASTADAGDLRRERDDLVAAAADLTAQRDALTVDRDRIRADADARAAAADARLAEADTRAAEAAARVRQTTEEIVRWRAAALGAWSRAVAGHPVAGSPAAPGELTFLRNHTHFLTQEMAAMKQTLSWRVTRPLRQVRRLGKLVGR